LIDAKRDVLQI